MMINSMSGKKAFSSTFSGTIHPSSSLASGLLSSQAAPNRLNIHMNVYLNKQQANHFSDQPSKSNPLVGLLSSTGYTQKSLRSTSNVTFSYKSPLGLRRNRSSEGRFSTKKYKDSRFPHLGKEGPAVHTQPINWSLPVNINQRVMGVLRLIND